MVKIIKMSVNKRAVNIISLSKKMLSLTVKTVQLVLQVPPENNNCKNYYSNHTVSGPGQTYLESLLDQKSPMSRLTYHSKTTLQPFILTLHCIFLLDSALASAQSLIASTNDVIYNGYSPEAAKKCIKLPMMLKFHIGGVMSGNNISAADDTFYTKGNFDNNNQIKVL